MFRYLVSTHSLPRLPVWMFSSCSASFASRILRFQVRSEEM